MSFTLLRPPRQRLLSGEELQQAHAWIASEGWDAESVFPIFRGGSYGVHVYAWKITNACAQDQRWRLAAIAASLERSTGGRPRREGWRRHQTIIQQFIADVDTNRQTFQRLVHTYLKFLRITRTPGGTSSGYVPELSFKHHEVAARLGDDVIGAIAEAREHRWSANELERQLAVRRKAGGGAKRRRFTYDDAYWQLDALVGRLLKSWPDGAHALVPKALRQLADDLMARWNLDDDLPDCLREPIPDVIVTPDAALEDLWS